MSRPLAQKSWLQQPRVNVPSATKWQCYAQEASPPRQALILTKFFCTANDAMPALSAYVEKVLHKTAVGLTLRMINRGIVNICFHVILNDILAKWRCLLQSSAISPDTRSQPHIMRLAVSKTSLMALQVGWHPKRFSAIARLRLLVASSTSIAKCCR